jgi:hypothetical protein
MMVLGFAGLAFAGYRRAGRDRQSSLATEWPDAHIPLELTLDGAHP